VNLLEKERVASDLKESVRKEAIRQRAGQTRQNRQ